MSCDRCPEQYLAGLEAAQEELVDRIAVLEAEIEAAQEDLAYRVALLEAEIADFEDVRGAIRQPITEERGCGTSTG